MEGEHRRAGGERLHHHHPERLRPADRHQERERLREQPLLVGSADLADVAHRAPVDVRLDLLGEEALEARLHGTGEHQRAAGRARHLDGAMRALLRCHPPDPQQVIAAPDARRPRVDVDRVGDDRVDLDPVRRVGRLRAAEADEPSLAAVPRVEAADLVAERPVRRVDERRADPIRHREGREAAVVVDDVERPSLRGRRVDRRERARDMVHFVDRAADPVRVRLGEQRAHARRRARSGRAEQLDVVPARDERLAQQRDDRLDPAVRRRRDRDPRGREHRDAQTRRHDERVPRDGALEERECAPRCPIGPAPGDRHGGRHPHRSGCGPHCRGGALR